MSDESHRELLDEIVRAADQAVRALALGSRRGPSFPELEHFRGLQERFGAEFPAPGDEVEFWETLWLRTDRVHEQWKRMEKAARRAGAGTALTLQPALDEGRRALYKWARNFVADRAPIKPSAAHFELGIAVRRPDFLGLHERLEGLYESVKRMGRFPAIREGLELPRDPVNFAIIYGAGWNVSSYSILREAEAVPGMNAFVAFDRPGADLYGKSGNRMVRLATAGLVRDPRESGEEYVLATFLAPVVLHFACPHEWTGTPPHELGIPVLRSDLVLEVVDDKLNTSDAIRSYGATAGVELPLPRERGVPQAGVSADLDELAARAEGALSELAAEQVEEVVVKPASGEQSRGIGFFQLPSQRGAAVHHAVRLGLESGVVVQERIRAAGPEDFNWRVLVALARDGQPVVVGRFARQGFGDDVEMVADREMLARSGVTGEEADRELRRLDEVSIGAFRAVVARAGSRRDLPHQPLGGGSYALPYILGVDLIADARVMEVNGHEVAGMWTDDRLYPETRGRSSRTVLGSALAAARSYRSSLEAGL